MEDTLEILRALQQMAGDRLRLYPPASDSDLVRAEHVLDIRLPPSYAKLLTVTNGLDLDALQSAYICGAGPSRAKWEAVLLNQWLDCQPYHEIAAQWRAFQGVYAYERIMDRERGENIFRSDERQLIPFAHTYETWCFDHARQSPDGERHIVLWDHEQREAEDTYATFAEWFAHEVASYLGAG